MLNSVGVVVELWLAYLLNPQFLNHTSTRAVHGSLSAVTDASFHASMLRPASQVGPMHESAGVGKLVNAELLSLINEACG